jgi:uncharacterized membrane protein (DUF2068 family)
MKIQTKTTNRHALAIVAAILVSFVVVGIVERVGRWK